MLLLALTVPAQQQIETRSSSDAPVRGLSMKIPLDISNAWVYLKNASAAVNTADKEEIQNALLELKETGDTRNRVVVLLDDGNSAPGSRTGETPYWYPEYGIWVDLLNLHQRKIDYIWDHDLVRLQDGYTNHIVVYRIESGQIVSETRKVKNYKVKLGIVGMPFFHNEPWYVDLGICQVISNHDSAPSAAAYNFLCEIDNKPALNKNEQLDFDVQN